MIRKINDDGQESILQEAHRLTHSDRNSTYGHPYDDYTCTAAIATAILGDALNRPITAHQMALLMCAVKLSRESRNPKRDNLVDLAGYAWVARMCHEEHTARDRAESSEDPIPLINTGPPHSHSLCWCGEDHRPIGLAPGIDVPEAPHYITGKCWCGAVHG
jgi:hypothetical protein